MSVEERCRAAWEREAAIRGEFGGRFSAFIGWERALAAGLIKDPKARSLLIDAPAAVTGKSLDATPALSIEASKALYEFYTRRNTWPTW